MQGNLGYNHKLFWPLTLIFVGVLIMMFNLGVLPASLWRLWPIALVILGLIGLAGDSGTTSRSSSKPARKRSRR